MGKRSRNDIIRRSEKNPVIDFADIPFECTNLYNAGCVKKNGAYVLLLTIEHLDGTTELYLAQGDDGYQFQVSREPFIVPQKDDPLYKYKTAGVLDARITRLEDYFYIIYLSESKHGTLLNLARTRDFSSVEKLGLISQPDTKAGALFPRKTNGAYARLDRPNTGGSIWISYSHDLLSWGESQVVLSPRDGFWDSGHIGCAAPPIEIDEGWLVFYYGVKKTSGGALTRIGAVILDKDDPAGPVVGRSNIPVLSPRELYERVGDISNIVFSCGAVIEEDKSIKLYYGTSNNCLYVGTTTLEEIIDTCLQSGKDF